MNRKWLWAVAAVVVLTAGTAWHFGWWSRRAPNVGRHVVRRDQGVAVGGFRIDKSEGDAEAAEPPIEPLVVESGWLAPTRTSAVPEAAPPVYLAPGMKQAPRPGAEPGRAPRMPYADEATLLPWPLDPIAPILEGTPLSRLKLFEKVKEMEPAEEAEPRDPMPPVEPAPAMPPPDYHQGHCPYLNGQYPYRR